MDTISSSEAKPDLERLDTPSCSLNTDFVEPRVYQQLIFAEVRDHNSSLVVLPTGLGKTVIMAYLIADCFSTMFRENESGLIVVVAPSKPLVDQIRKTLLECISINPRRIITLTGQIVPDKRKVAYQSTACIVATPQTIENDLLKESCDPERIKLILVDEAHRARGNYAYAKIIDHLDPETRIVGFTATPGKDEPSIDAVIKALRVHHLVFRTPEDRDIAPYAGEHLPKAYFISLGQIYNEIDKILCGFRDSLANNIRSLGYPLAEINHRTVNALTERLEEIKSRKASAVRTYAANLSRVLYLRSLLFSSGIEIVYQTLLEWRERPKAKLAGPNALKQFLKDPNTLAVEKLSREHPYPHPKYYKLLDILQEVNLYSDNSKIIVFAHHRATVKFLAKKLRLDGLNCLPLLGQSSQRSDVGMSQEKQRRIISAFKSELGVNVLIATQVAEEGIDVGACDLVIFYDVVTSPLRDIQRAGRGRRKKSRVVYLVAKQTPEERAYWALKEEGRKMERTLKAVQKRLASHHAPVGKSRLTLSKGNVSTSVLKGDSSTQSSTLRQIRIFVDSQLYSKEIVKFLQRNKIHVDVFTPPKEIDFVIQLPSGVHVLPLSVSRFWDLLTHSQWAEFTSNLQYLESPIIIIEGDLAKDVNPVILLQIQHDLQIRSGITVVHSPTANVTRRFVLDLILNDRPQKIQGSNLALQILCLIPDIGHRKAQALLEEFETLAKLSAADPFQIQQISGIGAVLSERIHKIFNKPS
ncbi:MAG: DEAD/DEAH box helicase family protein [Candidatus Thorarchaeota archaeon]